MRSEPAHYCARIRFQGIIGIVLALPGLATAAAQEPPVNTLHGVVVSKADGKPLAGVRVAMAHAEKGYLMLMQGGELQTFGQDEKVLLFFTKRNGQTTCEDTTDDEGRFTFKSFTSPGDRYNLVASHAEHGVTLLRGVIPRVYQDTPLRIEMEKPSFISTDWKAPSINSFSDRAPWEYFNVELAPKASDSEDTDNVYFYMYAAMQTEGQKELKLGPLPGGETYRVSRQMYLNPPGYSAVLFERDVPLKPGETVDIAVRGEGGTTIAGKVTGTDDQPLDKVSVTVVTKEPRLVLGAVTDAKGEYKIAGVPAGKHEFELLRHTVRTGPG